MRQSGSETAFAMRILKELRFVSVTTSAPESASTTDSSLQLQIESALKTGSAKDWMTLLLKMMPFASVNVKESVNR